MKIKNTIKMAGAVSALAAAVASTTANALPLNELFFGQYAGWDTASGNFTPGNSGFTGLFFDNATGGNPYPAGTASHMEWMEWEGNNGLGDDVSFIDITTYESDNLLAGDGAWNAGEAFIITELVHTNNVLSAEGGLPDPLWQADTLANFHVWTDAVNGADERITDLNSVDTIEFWESQNQNTCVGPAPLGTNCDDIFRTSASLQDPLSFDLLGYRYTVNFDLVPGPSTGGGTATTLICSSAGCSDGVTPPPAQIPGDEIWVFTPETAPGTSSIFVTATWSVEEIPEPAMVALFGVGVLGLGLAGRRRRKVAA